MHRPRVLSLLVALLFISSLTFPTASFAQTTADLVGRVTDASGAVLPGATVTHREHRHRDVRTTSPARPATTSSPCCRSARTPADRAPGLPDTERPRALTSGDRARVDGQLPVGA